MSEWAQPGADALLSGGTFPTTVYIARHTDDPGDDGTANAASDTRRIATDLDTPADGVVLNSTYGEILNATHAETITHISIWGASVAGVCYFIDELAVPLEIETGQTVSVAEAQLSISLGLWGA